jgi:hypothetical protein
MPFKPNRRIGQVHRQMQRVRLRQWIDVVAPFMAQCDQVQLMKIVNTQRARQWPVLRVALAQGTGVGRSQLEPVQCGVERGL